MWPETREAGRKFFGSFFQKRTLLLCSMMRPIDEKGVDALRAIPAMRSVSLEPWALRRVKPGLDVLGS
jgi:hypothetical protein